MDSILATIKKLLGIPSDVKDFDNDIIIFINTNFARVNQMGIGPLKAFKITGDTEKWSDFDTRLDMEDFKTYMFIKVKMLFDPPANTQLTESYNNTATELEYRLHALWDNFMKSDKESIQEWVQANSGEGG